MTELETQGNCVSYNQDSIASLFEAYQRDEQGGYIAEFAAAGITRAVIDIKIEDPDKLADRHVDSCLWASGLLLSKCTTIPDYINPEWSVQRGAHIDHVSVDSIGSVDHSLTAETLLEMIDDGPSSVLLIGLAHGGVIPAARVFKELTTITGDRNSIFYPIRYSTNKLGDTRPQISKEEESFLLDNVHGRSLVIIDDDYFTHSTIDTAGTHFARLTKTPVHWAVGYAASHRKPKLITGCIE